MKKSKKQTSLFKIIITALLIAINVILERIIPSYKVWNSDINFGFVAVAFAAVYLGTPYAVTVAALGDVIGSILFPFGAYFPGFTATNCIYGLILAEFIHKNATVTKIALAVIINKTVCSVILNSLWISLLYRGGIDAFWIVAIPRLPTTAMVAVIEFILITLIFSNKSKIRLALDKGIKKFIN